MILNHPFTCLVSGPTGSGKTYFVKSIIENNLIQPKPKKILWLYAADQPLHESLKQSVEFEQGIPSDLEERFDGKTSYLLIIDDLMTQMHSDERLTRLFTVGSHHSNLSVIFIIHNLFHQGKEMKNISRNTNYIVMFKNPRDKLQISELARQMFPGDTKFLIESFVDATSEPHGYLLLDLKPKTEDKFRIRTGILPGEVPAVYMSLKEGY